MLSDKASKQELLDKIKNCEIKVVALENDRYLPLLGNKNEFRSIYSTVEELDIKFRNERNSTKEELQQEISRIRNNVDVLHRMLSEMKPDPAFVEKLKQIMDSIETAITALKEKQKEVYESLMMEEKALSHELAAFEKKLDSWVNEPRGKPPELESHNVGKGFTKLTSSTMAPAVIEFENFIQQTGGREGGWNEYDHQVFIKTRSLFKTGNSAFLAAVAKELPTKTSEEITQHEQWYVKYSTLLESKKEAIEEWKTQRKARNKVPVEVVLTEASKPNMQELLSKEREERLAKLNAWKAEQKLKQIEAEEQRIIKQKQEKEKRDKELKRRAILKARVEEYVKKREAELSAKQYSEEEKKTQVDVQKRLANIGKFRERDKKILLEKQKKRESKEAERLEREKRLGRLKEQVEVKVERDPDRLYQLTEGWKERKKAGVEPEEDRTCLTMPRRAIPSWRQGT